LPFFTLFNFLRSFFASNNTDPAIPVGEPQMSRLLAILIGDIIGLMGRNTGNTFYWWGKMEYLEKTTDLPQVIDKLCHIILYQVHLS
jgi:hypothetical protein